MAFQIDSFSLFNCDFWEMISSKWYIGFERFSKSSLYLNMKMFMPSLDIEFRKNSEDKIKLKILMLSSLKYSSQKLK